VLRVLFKKKLSKANFYLQDELQCEFGRSSVFLDHQSCSHGSCQGQTSGRIQGCRRQKPRSRRSGHGNASSTLGVEAKETDEAKSGPGIGLQLAHGHFLFFIYFTSIFSNFVFFLFCRVPKNIGYAFFMEC